ncbi:MAG: protein kinase [Myxococcota bacterium]
MSSSGPQSRFTQPADPLIGYTLAGKYNIIKKLGEGGMGSVYQASQIPIDRMVAVKVLLGKLAQDEVAVKRFEQEARAVSKMQHPNTVTIYDYGKTEDDRLYIVMEFLRGKTLSDALRQSGGMDARRAIHIIRQVCASLAEAHKAGIIHRDLKPDNIFLTEVGGTRDFTKVLDFGVAKMADSEAASTLTQTGMIFGTPKYMSPEQAEGKTIDFRADIYAIGVVMYEMLTGRPPFLADTPVALLLKHISEPPKPFRSIRPDLSIPAELEGVVMKALEKSPDRRYLEVGEMSADLEHILRMVETGAVRVPDLSGHEPAPGNRVPTEVNPGQRASPDLSPADLRSPNQVPSGLSLNVPDIRRMPTEPAPPGPGQTTGSIGGMTGATSPGRLDAMGVGFGTGVTPTGQTAPIPGAGPGVDTMGGGLIGADLSQGVRAAPSRAPIFAGVGVVAAVAIGAAVYLRGGSTESVRSRPMDPPPSASAVPDPTPSATPTASAVPVSPTPVTPVTPSPSASASPSASMVARPTPRPSPSAAPGQARVNIHFESSPSGALVELDSGEQLGVTPFSKEFVKGADMMKVVFKLRGHESEPSIFTLATDRKITASLKKSAPEPTMAASPSPRPTPVPTKAPSPSPSSSNAINERVEDLK